MSVINAAQKKGRCDDPWPADMLKRKPRMVVAVALANRIARRLWAVVVKVVAPRRDEIAGMAQVVEHPISWLQWPSAPADALASRAREGEWNARKHGGPKRRVWRKIHLGIDEQTLEDRAVIPPRKNGEIT